MSVVKKFILFVRPVVVGHLPALARVYRYMRDNYWAKARAKVRNTTLAVACQYRRDNRPMVDEPRDTPMGFKLIGDPAMEKGLFEPVETEIVRSILDNVEVVVNVGANIGYYCCLALRRGKHVVAFEPMSGNLRHLYKNIMANGWTDRIEIFPMALSDRVGVIEIFGGRTGASLVKGWADTPERYVEIVPTSTLDNILGSRFQGRKCLVLVDIEGAEKLALEGATSFLSAEPRPVWMVEIAITAHQPKGTTINPHLLPTFEIFWERGYEAWTADESMRLVLPAEVEAIVESGEDTLLTHNFLFIEEGRKMEILPA